MRGIDEHGQFSGGGSGRSIRRRLLHKRVHGLVRSIDSLHLHRTRPTLRRQ
jgi:hypothetical protein